MSITLEKISKNEGPEYILLNKYDGIYRTWTTSETFLGLITELLSQVPEKYRIEFAEKILKNELK